MSEIKDGGPAFPRTGVGNAGVSYDVPPQDGISMRDYFAAAALTGLIEAPGAVNLLNGYPEFTLHDNSAVVAYKYADAMLAAREKGTA